MTWTSFDRFGRYARVAEQLDSLVPAGAMVIDVGDSSGYLEQFLPDCRSIAVDLHPADAPFPGVRFVQADGTALPLSTGAAAAAISCDALEHLPDGARDAFVGELCRVARDVVVLAAPFDTFGVRGAEDAVARYAKVLLGEDQPQLTEHAERGLPRLEAAADALARRGWDVQISGEGNLHDWLGMMLLRFGADAHASTVPLGDGLDVLYNHLLPDRSGIGPYYRHLLVATPGRGAHGQVRGLDEALAADGGDIDSVAASFVSQTSLLVTAPALRRAEHALGQIQAATARVEHAVASSESSRKAIEAAVRDLGAHVGGLAEQVDLLRARQAELHARVELQHRRSLVGVLGRVRRRFRRS